MHVTEEEKSKTRSTSRCDCLLNSFPIGTEDPTPAIFVELMDGS